MSRVMRLALLLLAELWAAFEVNATAVLEVAVATATSAMVVEASPVSATRCVRRNTPANSCEELAFGKQKHQKGK